MSLQGLLKVGSNRREAQRQQATQVRSPGGCPLSLHIVMGEMAGLENYRAQLGNATATSVIKMHKSVRPRTPRRLEQDSNRLNQKEDSQFWSFMIQDAGWGWGPA